MYASLKSVRVVKSRRMRREVRVACVGEKRNAYGVQLGKPEGKRRLARPRYRW